MSHTCSNNRQKLLVTPKSAIHNFQLPPKTKYAFIKLTSPHLPFHKSNLEWRLCLFFFLKVIFRKLFSKLFYVYLPLEKLVNEKHFLVFDLVFRKVFSFYFGRKTISRRFIPHYFNKFEKNKILISYFPTHFSWHNQTLEIIFQLIFHYTTKH